MNPAPYFLATSVAILLFDCSEPKTEMVTRLPESIQSPKTEYSLTFTPDEQTLFFVRRDSFFVPAQGTIYQSRKVEGAWTEPVPAAFSGTFHDSSPFVSPDGKKLFFTSSRPVGGDSISQPNIWVVELAKSVPGKPVFLSKISSGKGEYGPTVDQEGNLYFGSYREGGFGWGDLWMARWNGTGYDPPENLGPAINTEGGEWDGCIAPDGSYLVFEASGREENLSESGDLFLSFQTDTGWTTAFHFPAPINSTGSDLTPKIHGDWLYFGSNRHPNPEVVQRNHNVDLYRISLEELVRRARE